MSDRELLELAAKAAGMHVVGSVDQLIVQPDESKAGGFVIRNQAGGDSCWNPLKDDGDALRLAVKLGICCKYERNAPPELNIPRECGVAITDAGKWFVESDERDPYASTRRGIVRAAAEIGKAMP